MGPSDHRAGWIVGIAEIDHVHWFSGWLWNKSIGGCAGQIDQPFVATACKRGARVSLHDIVVYIDRIHRVTYGGAIATLRWSARRHDFHEGAGIWLTAVGKKDLVRRDSNAAITVITLHNGLADKVITSGGAIATERRAIGEFIDRGVHGRNDRGGKRLSDIADAAADDLFGNGGVRLCEYSHSTGDFREQVAGGQLQVVVVDECHRSQGGARCAVRRERSASAHGTRSTRGHAITSSIMVPRRAIRTPSAREQYSA